MNDFRYYLEFLKGRGRAFCAGGDIVGLYKLINEGTRWICFSFWFTLQSGILSIYLQIPWLCRLFHSPHEILFQKKLALFSRVELIEIHYSIGGIRKLLQMIKGWNSWGWIIMISL